ncbi:glycosyltransferase [Pseudochelatococcus sp. G4_1912]|uniref:glycosyltransferase n=1 Tax=Pseudochelatococcus sp. G4_1912 TaxID=3114288 RepID=UPI0039C61153
MRDGSVMIKNQPARVSVVITAYNHERFINETLDSVLSQDAGPLEIIVVDDCSRDNTLAIAQSYAGRGVRVITKPNGGPSSALNAGIACATGDIIILLSGDDVLLPDSIAPRCEALALSGADVVSAVPRWIDESGRVLTSNEHPHVFAAPEKLKPVDMFSRLFFHGNFICAPSVAITRRCLEAVGAFDETLWQLQDFEYWLRVSAKGFGFYFLQQPLIKYRMHSRNLSTSNPERLRQENELVLANAAQFLSAPDLQELLFGEGFREIDLGLDATHLAHLLTIRHSYWTVRSIGRWELSKVLKDSHAYAQLVEKFTLGL